MLPRYCGKTGIRTLEPRKGLTVFETAPFDHSGIFPMVYFCFAGANLALFSQTTKLIFKKLYKLTNVSIAARGSGALNT